MLSQICNIYYNKAYGVYVINDMILMLTKKLKISVIWYTT